MKIGNRLFQFKMSEGGITLVPETPEFDEEEGI